MPGHFKMMELAYGEMGLSPAELAGLTPFQFELKLTGFRESLLRREEDFRNLAYIFFAMNADPKASKNVTKDDIWPNGRTIKKARVRNDKTKAKVYEIMMEKFRKQNQK